MMPVPVKRDRLVRPGHRKPPASLRPSHAGASFPLQDYIIPPRDPMGASSRVSLTVQPNVLRLAKKIREGGGLPFETTDDVLRWAVYHGLMKLVELSKNPDIKSAFNELRTWVEVASVEEGKLYYQKAIKKIFVTVERLESGEHPTRAVELAERVWRGADREEDPYWRKVFRDLAKRALDTMKRKNGNGGGRG